MHKEILDKKTEHVFEKINKSEICNNFYLAGGTALALQFGHRKSIDLDWFSKDDFNTAELKEKLEESGELSLESEERNTLNIILDGVKVSFLGYRYSLLFPLLGWEGIKIADWRDIACMKLDAVSSRGSKKDFIDLYFILKQIPVSDLLEFFNKKYKGIEYNRMHIFKSLNYFKDADEEPMPIMIESIKWQDVKKFFNDLVKGLV